jgi:transposase
MNEEIVYSIGVDLHKDSMTIVVLDAKGDVVERKKIATKCKKKVSEFFSSYGLRCQVAVESVGFYQWFWELVRPLVGKMFLADPAGVKAYCGRKPKNDRNDAHLLARLTREGILPTAYVPEDPVHGLRELVRLRHSVAKNLRTARRSLRWISLKSNLPGPKDLTSDRAQKWILAQDSKFSEVNRLAARLRLDMIIYFERHLADIERAIVKRILAVPGLRGTFELLTSIPGVGPITASTIIVETGDITRFDNPEQLSSYAGLCPRVSQAGESFYHGHISKMGPPLLRWVLQQAAWVAYRSDENARRIINRISRKNGKKKAATAMARKILVYAWSVCRKQRPFQWPENFAKQNPEKKITAFENPQKRRKGCCREN